MSEWLPIHCRTDLSLWSINCSIIQSILNALIVESLHWFFIRPDFLGHQTHVKIFCFLLKFFFYKSPRLERSKNRFLYGYSFIR